MNRSTLRRSLISAPLAVVAAVVLATNALAASPTWNSAVTVRQHNNIALDDAAFMGTQASVGWTEPTSGAPRIGVKNWVEVGFGPTQFISASRNVAVDICGSALSAAWERRVAPGEWRVVYSESSIDMNDLGIGIQQVDPGSADQMTPDVACTSSRSFVSWYEPDGDGARMFLAHRLFNDFSDPVDLGFDNETFFGNSLATAGAGSNAYVVFQRSDGDLRFKRFSVGAGPGFPVTAHATQVIVNATSSDEASYAVIDATGDRVAVSWFRCDGVYARVSDDNGTTWKPIRKLVDAPSCDGDFAAAPNSIALRGDRIALAYSAAGAFGGGCICLIRTTTEFASFTDDPIWNDFQPEHLVGYMTFGGNVKLAGAFEKPGIIKFRRQQ